MLWIRISANAIRVIAATLISLFISACGGGGGAPVEQAPPPPPPANSAPTSDAGGDQSAQAGDLVVLDGTAIDPEGGALVFNWVQVAGPTVSLFNSSSQRAEFRASYIEGNVSLEFEFTATDSGGLRGTDRMEVLVTSEFTACSPTAPPSELLLDSFYEKYCDAGGIPVVSSSRVPDRALEWVRFQALKMMGQRPDVVQSMINLKTRVAIMADTEVTTDIPEHSDLYVAFPGTDWDVRARGLSATPARPASSAAEENILCYGSDAYIGEDIFLHEFAHTMDVMGLRFVDASFQNRLAMTFDAAMAAGLWVNTYAATNKEEYWAEGVQDWFDSNLQSNPPNGIHNFVNTRQELAAYDPALYQLILEVMPEIDIPHCPQ